LHSDSSLEYGLYIYNAIFLLSRKTQIQLTESSENFLEFIENFLVNSGTASLEESREFLVGI